MDGPDRPLHVDNFDDPELAEGGALLKTIASEVCGTDVHMYHGRLPGAVPFPIIPGHISVGELQETHGQIVDIYGQPFKRGEVVAFNDVYGTCHGCAMCLKYQATTRCPQRRVYGITFGTKDGLCGGWSEKILLKRGVQVLRLPDGLDAETYIGGGCGLNTAAHAIDEASIRLGDTVAVLGAGPVGQSLTAFSKISGAEQVITIGAPQDRLEYARKMGADNTCNIETVKDPGERVAWVLEHTHGFGADVVFEATGIPDAVTQALDMVRDGGTVVVVGQYTDNGTTRLDPYRQLNKKNITIKGSWGSRPRDFITALAIMGKYHTKFPWKEMAARGFSLDKVNEALGVVDRREVLKAVIRPNG